jgi:hypothetical protein
MMEQRKTKSTLKQGLPLAAIMICCFAILMRDRLAPIILHSIEHLGLNPLYTLSILLLIVSSFLIVHKTHKKVQGMYFRTMVWSIYAVTFVSVLVSLSDVVRKAR